MLRHDSVASAYIAAGRLDRIAGEQCIEDQRDDSEQIFNIPQQNKEVVLWTSGCENNIILQHKLLFLSSLQLIQVPPQYKEGIYGLKDMTCDSAPTSY